MEAFVATLNVCGILDNHLVSYRSGRDSASVELPRGFQKLNHIEAVTVTLTILTRWVVPDTVHVLIDRPTLIISVPQ